jgi:hypothetical protein
MEVLAIAGAVRRGGKSGPGGYLLKDRVVAEKHVASIFAKLGLPPSDSDVTPTARKFDQMAGELKA